MRAGQLINVQYPLLEIRHHSSSLRLPRLPLFRLNPASGRTMMLNTRAPLRHLPSDRDVADLYVADLPQSQNPDRSQKQTYKPPLRLARHSRLVADTTLTTHPTLNRVTLRARLAKAAMKAARTAISPRWMMRTGMI